MYINIYIYMYIYMYGIDCIASFCALACLSPRRACLTAPHAQVHVYTAKERFWSYGKRDCVPRTFEVRSAHKGGVRRAVPTTLASPVPFLIRMLLNSAPSSAPPPPPPLLHQRSQPRSSLRRRWLSAAPNFMWPPLRALSPPSRTRTCPA